MLVFFVGLALWAYSSVNDALNYTEVEAIVDRIEEVCVPVGEPAEAVASGRCTEARSSPAGKWWFRRAVYVRYRFPADGQQHTGAVTPIGGQSAGDALKLRAGEHWKILVHDDKPQDIKAN